MKQSLGMLSLYGVSKDAMDAFIEAMETLVDTGIDDDNNINDNFYADIDLDSDDNDDDIDAKDGESAIHGGSGEDAVILAGSRSHYTITQEGEYTVYTDSNGRSVKVANDVKTVEFES
jgi:hypothetical protein